MQIKSLHPSHWRTGFANRIVYYSSFFLPDETYLKFKFRMRAGYSLDLNNPRTFNEKLNWLKLYYRKPEFTLMADKYEAKKIVKEIIGSDFVVPCFGVWENIKDENFDALNYPIVLKATNDSSGVTICKSRESIDVNNIIRKFEKNKRNKHYLRSREYVYKDILPRIIADKYLDDGTGHELVDYKFWCFNGVPRVMYCTNKGKKIFENFYDMQFHPLSISRGFDRFQPEFQKPLEFEQMKELAAKLSIGLPFVRIDFFDVRGRVYFAEFTFYDWGGMRPFTDIEWDYKLGEMISLPL